MASAIPRLIPLSLSTPALPWGPHDGAAHTVAPVADEASTKQQTAPADRLTFVVAHATIFAEGAPPGADAVGVNGATIVAVGSSQELGSACPPSSCVLVDARG